MKMVARLLYGRVPLGRRILLTRHSRPYSNSQNSECVSFLAISNTKPPLFVHVYTYIYLTFSHGVVVVTVRQGFPVLSLPLPSRNETCDFVLRPYLQNVSDITSSIQNEDRGIER